MDENILGLNDTLSVLSVADWLNWQPVSRTNFQKVLYFCAVLSPLIELNWKYYFSNAPYGPFNRTLLKAPDRLVIYGDAKVSDVLIQRDSKLRATYLITERGKTKISTITRLESENQRYQWIHLVMSVLSMYGQGFITKLAYQEPNFERVRNGNIGGIIDLEENLSVELINNIEEEFRHYSEIQLDTNASKMLAYFDYISSEFIPS